MIYVGQTRFFRTIFRVGTSRSLEAIVDASLQLSSTKCGALIVVQRETGLRIYKETGTSIKGEVSSGLLLSIFNPSSPLHDGAVIIQENRVAAAACFLPLTVNAQSTNLGTRHRAAIGLTEESDAVALIVSEETGIVSLVLDGEIESGLDSKQLAKHLDSAMHPRHSRRRSVSKKAE